MKGWIRKSPVLNQQLIFKEMFSYYICSPYFGLFGYMDATIKYFRVISLSILKLSEMNSYIGLMRCVA